MTGQQVSRRVALLGAGGAVVVLGVAACGASDNTTMKTVTGNGPVPSSDIPVGGAVYLPDISVIVTQPTKGQFKAFSSICTHQGCPVTQVMGKNLLCPCHGSQFSLATGAVEAGPAPSPLPAKKATVQGDSVAIN